MERPFDLWLAKTIPLQKQTVEFNQRSTFLALIAVRRDLPIKRLFVCLCVRWLNAFMKISLDNGVYKRFK